MEAAPIRIDRKPSIETEPRTLGMDQIEFAREAAKYVVNTKNIEEAMRIFTEGLEPVVSSIQQSGDEVTMASVEEPEYSEDYYRRPRGSREIVSAPF